ncbi:TPA: hypothetical protein IAC10_00555 [Candidatus Scatousia excrementigallinarum]|uniref:Uncharacterized protein n=1 Tax=Candidatus Scatousia excrementigallinarum TaxID=2840935 RepID=A0A9D1EWH2_9BACT|nr:hypothetical protein [Candidatus Scatousia excrementigallinarum]
MVNFEGKIQLNNKITQIPLNKLEKILPAEKIDLMLKKIKARADFEMTDTGTFQPIKEAVKNTKPVIELGDISLSIKSTSNLNNCKERILEAAVSTKSGQYTIEQPLIQGNREEIIKYLNDEKFDENFKRFLMDCSDNFEKKGLE